MCRLRVLVFTDKLSWVGALPLNIKLHPYITYTFGKKQLIIDLFIFKPLHFSIRNDKLKGDYLRIFIRPKSSE